MRTETIVAGRSTVAERAAWDFVEREGGGTGYLAGDGFTLADINILPMLFYVNRFEEGKEMLAGAKSLSDYMVRHFDRPSFKKSMPPPPKS